MYIISKVRYPLLKESQFMASIKCYGKIPGMVSTDVQTFLERTGYGCCVTAVKKNF